VLILRRGPVLKSANNTLMSSFVYKSEIQLLTLTEEELLLGHNHTANEEAVEVSHAALDP